MQSTFLSNEEHKNPDCIIFVKRKSVKNDGNRLWARTPQYLLQIHEQKCDVDHESFV